MTREAHLQMIQSVVSRLAAQSTTIKGWCVTLTAALLGYGATAAAPIIIGLALYVIVAFAILDAYYLVLERKYRDLYLRSAGDDQDGWSLTVGRPTAGQIIRGLRSPVLVILYGMSLVVAVGVGLHLLLK
ncbi:hypothetical protein ABZ671_29500 [Micromonospora sp. NPDC006766]|uniref:hypothetical protein n=1 Tax=Micromonospora sp. NPDC006766 TaxID=3154778 RepID=UPI0033DA6375